MSFDGLHIRSVAAVVATVAAYGLTIGLVAPLLSLALEYRGFDRSVIGALTMVFSLGTFMASFIVPALVGRLGFRLPIVASIAVECLLFALLPVFDSIGAWFVIRFFMGVVAAVLFIAAETWLNSMVPDAIRGRIMGLYNTVVSATFAVGPAVIMLVGVSGYIPYLIGIMFLALAALPMLGIKDKTFDHQPVRTFGLWSFWTTAPVITFAVLLAAFKDTALLSLLPVYGVRSGLSEEDAVFMLAIVALGSTAGQIPVGWLADRFDRVHVLLGCGICGLAGSLLLPYAVSAGVLGWVILFLWGAGFYGLFTVALTLVGQRFRGHDLTMANAALGIWWGVGSMAGPVAAGVAMDIIDPGGLPLAMIASTLAFSLLVGRWIMRRAGGLAVAGP